MLKVSIMGTTVCIPKEEYDELIQKASLFEHYVKTEELSKDELKKIEESMKGPFMTKLGFLRRHPELR